jgi:hypothetical protein
MSHALTGRPESLAIADIDSGAAFWIKAASFTIDRVQINFYSLNGRILRCEYDEDCNERLIDEVEGHDLADFMHCHNLL